MYSKLILFLTAALLLLGTVTITPTLFAAGTTLTNPRPLGRSNPPPLPTRPDSQQSMT